MCAKKRKIDRTKRLVGFEEVAGSVHIVSVLTLCCCYRCCWKPEILPYVQGGGQWHQDMTYKDEYFPSGQSMLDEGKRRFGYEFGYLGLGTYHALYIMYKNVESYFKTEDEPMVARAFDQNYEQIRRELLGLNVPLSINGPTAFDRNRRNVGRGSAGMVSSVCHVDWMQATKAEWSPSFLTAIQIHFTAMDPN